MRQPNPKPPPNIRSPSAMRFVAGATVVRGCGAGYTRVLSEIAGSSMLKRVPSGTPVVNVTRPPR